MADEQGRKDLDKLVEEAKWQMYGEDWTQASRLLQDAKRKAVESRDKEKIDLIIDLQKKAGSHQKVPVP